MTAPVAEVWPFGQFVDVPEVGPAGGYIDPDGGPTRKLTAWLASR